MSLSKVFANNDSFVPTTMVDEDHRRPEDKEWQNDTSFSEHPSAFAPDRRPTELPPAPPQASAGQPPPAAQETEGDGSEPANLQATAQSPPMPEEADVEVIDNAAPLLSIEEMREQISLEIREEAYNQGVQTGLEQAEIQFSETLQALTGALEEVDRLRETILINNTNDMVETIMVIAQQVLQAELSIKQDTILTTINEALQAAVEADEYRIKINPDDHKIVEEHKPTFLAGINGLKNIILESDPQIARGGCLVESNTGQVDATIETKLSEIRSHLLNSIDKG